DVLVALRVNVAFSGPPNGSPGTPENKKITGPVTVTVVLLPEVEIVHCCWAPLTWKYWANVTGAAITGPTATRVEAQVRIRPPNHLDLIFIVYNPEMEKHPHAHSALCHRTSLRA